MKNGGYERFMFGFHVFRSVEDDQPRWQWHSRLPTKLRVLDYTQFNSGILLSVGLIGMITTSTFI